MTVFEPGVGTPLAAGESFVELGLDGFPHEVRDWYRRGFGNITVRLRHAVEFAPRGIEGVWFAFTPTADPESTRELGFRSIAKS